MGKKSFSVRKWLDGKIRYGIQSLESAAESAVSDVMKPKKQGATRVFVYGSLRRGRANSGKLRSSDYLGSSEADGFILVQRPGGQAISPGRGTVHGDVYDVDTETLRRLDRYHGMSLRRQKIRLSNGATAWTWVWPQDMDYPYESSDF